MTSVDVEFPPEDAKRLAAFIGEWRVEGSMSVGEDQAAISGRWRFEETVNGWGVLGAMDTEIEGMGVFQENELIGFDPVGGEVHLFSMNRFAIRDHVGSWTEKNTLVVRYTAQGEDDLLSEEITVEFLEPGRIDGRVVEQSKGSVAIETTLSMHRIQ